MIYLLIGFFLSGAKISMQIKAFISDNYIQTLNFAIKNDRLWFKRF